MDGDVFFLYKYTGSTDDVGRDDEVKVFHSTIAKPFFNSVSKAQKTKEYNDLYTELRWMAASLFRLNIYYIENEGRIVHTSFCTPRSFKFPFMKKGDHHIGPCFTDAVDRGKGIYGKVLKRIALDLKKDPHSGDIYMIIEENNTASRNGVQKAGFSEVAKLHRKGRLKRYYVKEWI